MKKLALALLIVVGISGMAYGTHCVQQQQIQRVVVQKQVAYPVVQQQVEYVEVPNYVVQEQVVYPQIQQIQRIQKIVRAPNVQKVIVEKQIQRNRIQPVQQLLQSVQNVTDRLGNRVQQRQVQRQKVVSKEIRIEQINY